MPNDDDDDDDDDSSKYRDSGRATEYKIGTAVNEACKEISPRAIVSPALV